QRSMRRCAWDCIPLATSNAIQEPISKEDHRQMSTKKAPAATRPGGNKERSSRAEMKSRRQIERQQRKRRRQLTLIGIIAVVAVALVGILYAANQRAQASGTSLLGNPGRAVPVMS